jgi:putative lipoic acid-binding regulatory protein
MNAGKATEPDSPLKFPCRFPIKAMGRHDVDFEAQVLAMVCGHLDAGATPAVTTRSSSNGRFLSVTVTILAESREQLDDIYRTLTASEQVLLVL